MTSEMTVGGNFNSAPSFYSQIPASGTVTISSSNLYTVPSGCSIAYYNFAISGVVVVQGLLYVAATFTLNNCIIFNGGTLVVA
jgi:hypothetical protein